jgi:5,10-methylenetetrahydromethanopterin reductase
VSARLESVEVGLASYCRIPDLVACAQAAEGAGIQRFWLAENYYFRTSTVMATAVALATRSIGIGLGVLNPFTRLAPLIAMETATLDELSGGRVTLALGAGRTPERHLGLDRSRSVSRLGETVDVCRRLLGGETLDYAGKVYRIAPGAMRLGFRPPRGAAVPIYLAGMGPRTLRLAGEMADGIFLDVFTSPGFVRGMRPHVEEGLRRGGRTLADVFFGTYVVFAVDRDGRAARDLVKPTLVDYLRARMVADERMAHAGIAPEAFGEVRAGLQAAWARGGMDEAVRFMPDWICDRLAVCGTPDECCAGLQAYADAGIRTVALFNVLGRDPVEAIRLIAREIAPRVSG